MIREKQHVHNFLTRIGLIVLFFIVVSAFSNSSVANDNNISQQEFISDLQSYHVNATVSNAVQLPDYHKDQISFIDKSNFRYSDIRLLQ